MDEEGMKDRIIRDFAANIIRLGNECRDHALEVKRLKAENERLRKAGDGLHAFLINYIVDSRISSAYLNKLDDGWTAAKEGKGL